MVAALTSTLFRAAFGGGNFTAEIGRLDGSGVPLLRLE